MKSRLAAVAVSALAVVAGAVVTASPASAAPYALTSVSLDPGPVTVVGLLGSGTAHVTVSLTSSPAVDQCGDEPGVPFSGRVGATLSRISGGSSTAVNVVLDLASGTKAAGTWTGQWRIGSGSGGTWQVSRVYWCNGQNAMSGDDGYSVDPRVTPGYHGTLQVNATAPPRVTVTRIPTIAAYGAAQSVRVTYANSRGTPLAGRKVTYGVDTSCGFYDLGGSRLTLDSRGGVTVRLQPLIQCLLLTEPQVTWVTPSTTVIDARQLTGRSYYKRVSAKPITPTFTIGTAPRVAAYAYPGTGRVSLQVLYGRTWRTIDYKDTSVSNLNLHVPTTVNPVLVRGRHTYRVLSALAPGQGDYLAPTSSSTFTMTGR
jgi:hypothetical protein